MRVHFSFVCGKGVAQLAVVMKQMGHIVSGSDTGFFPPVSTYLEENNIKIISGISADNITPDIDLLVLGGSAFIKVKDQINPEYDKAKELEIKVIGFDELMGEILAAKTTIDVVGTYGKSTNTALLAWILENAGYNPNFMIGAIPLNFAQGVRKSNSDYAVFEGDEHPLLHFHEGGKFMYHKPTHVLLTAAKWDHINVYKTVEDYIQCYIDLMNILPDGGFVIANLEGENIMEVVNHSKVPVIFYSANENSIEEYKKIKESNPEKFRGLYLAKDIKFDSDYTRFIVDYIDYPRNEDWTIPDQMLFESPLIGLHNVQNALGTIAMALGLHVRLSAIQNALRSFKNVKQRMEFVGNTKSGTTIIEDFAHSPVKAKETLKALRTRFKNNKIYAVFDAHSSLLQEKETLKWLPGTFDLANEVIIPKVTVKKDTAPEERVFGKDIVAAIQETQSNVKYMPIDNEIIDYLNKTARKDDVIIFMSSGDWREIISILKV